MPIKYEDYPPERQIIHDAVNEMWIARELAPLEPTADIDMVWVLSAPGTVYEPPTSFPYDKLKDDEGDGYLFNLNLVNEGIRVVKGVTAARLQKDPVDVTKEDVAMHGPVLFYNGESESNPDQNYRQNEDLQKMVNQDDFPLPASRVVIDSIEQINTPGQIKGLGDYLKAHRQPRKIATVFGTQHGARVGRYLEKEMEQPEGARLFSEETEFVPDPVNQPGRESAIAAGEALRVRRYYPKYLARYTIFQAFKEGISGRPHVNLPRVGSKKSKSG